MLLMVEKSIRGEIYHSIYRYVKANNNYKKDHDKNKKSSCTQYLDINNLYSWANSCSSLRTLALQDLHLIWAVLMSSQRAKQLLSTDWSYITLLKLVKLSHLLIKKGSHKRYATLTALAVVWALWSFKIFIWSDLRFDLRNSCCHLYPDGTSYKICIQSLFVVKFNKFTLKNN